MVRAADILKLRVDARSSTYTLHAIGNRIHTWTLDFKLDTSPDPTPFEFFLKSSVGATNQPEDDLRKKWQKFVEKYHCTHYIRAIMMGALEYEVLSVLRFKGSSSC